MYSKKLTPEQVALYHQQGYIVVKDFCSKAEIDKLYDTTTNDNAILIKK